MRWLITADWQAEWQNLDSCEQAWEQVLNICTGNKLTGVIVNGDLKRQYNPIDVRVALWWQAAIRKARHRGYEVLVNLGNHDRVGQYSDAINWLQLLRNAGAECFDEPTVRWAGKNSKEGRLFVLPFAGVSQTRQWAKQFLNNHPDKTKDVLVFHQDLKGARYNRLGGKSDAHLTVSDLHVDSYSFVIGGHIHDPQLVDGTKNTYYVGSPFCTDWGEVNQRKRYLVVRSSKITTIYSDIAGWLDPGVSGFREARPSSYDGARIRVQVLCGADEDYGATLDQVRGRYERKYRGATIYVIPKFKDDERTGVQGLEITDSDERKIREYVRQTERSSELRSGALEEYMLEKLSHFAGGLRAQAKMEFVRGKGRHFTSFEKLDLDYRKKGITVIQGLNLDRGGKSNGSGKTNALQLIPVSWFGRTFKGQTHDRWGNRWEEKESAIAKTVMKDYKGRKISITRGRRPPLLQMKIDGVDKSSGMKSTDRDGTQAQIEQVTGFTWQTLANAIYIDRSVADAFLSGTKKQRTELLSRFQNLERFAQALELVRKDDKQNSKELEDVGSEYSDTKGRLQQCIENLSEMRVVSAKQLDGAYDEWQKYEREYSVWEHREGRKLKKLGRRVARIVKQHAKALKEASVEEKAYAVIQADYNRVKQQSDEWVGLINMKKCPTCFQTVSTKWLKDHGTDIVALGNELKESLERQHKRVANAALKERLLEGKHDGYQMKISRLERDEITLRAVLKTSKRQYNELYEKQHGTESLLGKMRQKVKALELKKSGLKHNMKKLRKRQDLYQYVMQAFSRDGIPAFLNRQLCPVLNKAAGYYAELFSDNELQVRFKVEEGEFVPQVINARGGADIEDQSTGERALAGLIASFALREVAPQCNLLILDEPGEGLDGQTARQFAQALQKLKKRFGSIFITTHNQVILSELSGERMLTVRKKNRISKILEAA